MTKQQTMVTKSADRLELQRRFAAPKELVFAAWTEPDRMKQWLHPSPDYVNPSIAVDLRVGGEYHIEFLNPQTQAHSKVAGRFLEIDPNRKLVYTWAWEEPTDFANVQTQVTVEFADDGNDTLVTLTHERFASKEMCDRHTEGWSGTFECLTTVIAENKM